MSKLMSLQGAIQDLVQDGDCVYAAGFTHLIPFAAGHEIIRQGKRELVLARATPDLIYDQMVAAGCARKVVFSYAGNPGVGSLRSLRSAIENGGIEWEEYSHYGMITRLTAAAAGLPFLPMRATAAEDLPRVNSNYHALPDPYTGEEVMLLPPLNPDVAIVHVQRADEEGNAHVWGIIGEQREVAFAARKVILTVEQIVEPELIRSDPNRTLVPGLVVDAVCEVPFCAHPSYAQGYYDRDNAFYLEWDRISADPDRLEDWLREWVFELEGRSEYWSKLGPEVQARLEVEPRWSEPVNYGRY